MRKREKKRKKMPRIDWSDKNHPRSIWNLAFPCVIAVQKPSPGLFKMQPSPAGHSHGTVQIDPSYSSGLGPSWLESSSGLRGTGGSHYGGGKIHQVHLLWAKIRCSISCVSIQVGKRKAFFREREREDKQMGVGFQTKTAKWWHSPLQEINCFHKPPHASHWQWLGHSHSALWIAIPPWLTLPQERAQLRTGKLSWLAFINASAGPQIFCRRSKGN